MTDTRHRILVAVFVGVIGLGLYAATLAPGLTWAYDSGDGGDLAAAAHTLGIAHPPGYPTYVLLAHPWTHLPFGEVATRTNLFSAACAAGAAAVLAWAVARAGGDWIAATVAGLALACAPLHWSQAIVTEVHALSSLFGAVLLSIAVSAEAWRDNCRPRSATFAAVSGLLWGLSLGNSPTAAFYLPLVVVAVGPVRRNAVFALSALAAGLTVYAFLPVRAVAEPAVNWGNPQTFDGFYWVVSAALYRRFAFGLPLSSLPARMLSTAQLLGGQFGLAGLAVASVGIASSWTKRRALLAATATASILFVAFSVGYDTTDSYLYLTPVLIFLGFWLGAGAARIILVARPHARSSGLAVGLGAATILAQTIAIRLPTMDLSSDRSPDAFRATVLDSAPAQALILSQRDSHTFALWYYLHAMGQRPDVAVVDVGLLGLDWYNGQVAADLAGADPVAALDSGGIEGLTAAAQELGRPVCRISGDGATLSCAGR